MKSQEGFTLVELMIALALGLIVVAAATLLFLTGLRSSSMQQGVSDLQDNANFGLNYITQTKQYRLKVTYHLHEQQYCLN
jgi:type IV pilus assembly protein PilW